MKTDNVETNNSNGKHSLAEFLQTTDYEELKDKIKFDILSDPRLFTLKELFELFQSLDTKLGRIENRLLNLEVSK